MSVVSFLRLWPERLNADQEGSKIRWNGLQRGKILATVAEDGKILKTK